MPKVLDNVITGTAANRISQDLDQAACGSANGAGHPRFAARRTDHAGFRGARWGAGPAAIFSRTNGGASAPKSSTPALDRVRGSHHVFKHTDRPGHIVVPHPKKDLGTGLVAAIRKQAGL